MSTPAAAAAPSTRQLAKAAGWALLREGQRPTAERIRQRIGQGAQQTILSALDELWQEVGERVADPRLPPALHEPMTALWAAAVHAAGEQWAQARAVLVADGEALQARVRQLEAALMAGEAARAALAAQGEEQAAALATTTAQLATAEAERVAQGAALAAQLAATAAAEQARAALAAQFDEEQARAAQALDQARQTLRETEKARVALAAAGDQVRRELAARERELASAQQELARAQQAVTGLTAQLASRETDWARVVGENARLHDAWRAAERATQAAEAAHQVEAARRAAAGEAVTQLEAQLAQAAATQQALNAELVARRQQSAVEAQLRERLHQDWEAARRALVELQADADPARAAGQPARAAAPAVAPAVSGGADGG